jgi:glycosyltransferase involved in cell wall biosynthesis
VDCRRFVVESSYAEGIARHYADADDEGAIARIPIPYPQYGAPDPIVSEASVVAAVAGPGAPRRSVRLVTLIEAIGILVGDGHDLRLAVIGAVRRLDRSRAVKQARAAGIAERVRFRPVRWPAELEHALRAATIAVQLFDRSSEALTEEPIAPCLAAGLPTIASAVGAIHELPDSSVVKLEPGSSAADVAAAIRTLVADPDLRQRLRAAGLAHAAERQPARIAAELRRLIAAAG